jgi:hypothetical protein
MRTILCIGAAARFFQPVVPARPAPVAWESVNVPVLNGPLRIVVEPSATAPSWLAGALLSGLGALATYKVALGVEGRKEPVTVLAVEGSVRPKLDLQKDLLEGKVVGTHPGRCLTKNIKTPDPIPDEGIRRATEIMQTGRLYRYNADSAETCEVSKCEQAFAEYTGHKYVVSMNSCGSALAISLLAAGVKPGDKVLSNVFTFGAVPSAIVHAGAEPVYVNCTPGYILDADDLEKKAKSSGAKFCMVSHMRGKVADMDRIVEICEKYDMVLLEDCAHSLGVTWNGKHTGHHGRAACFSSQSYKMLNSGEGGFFATNDEDYMAKAMYYAGCYETLYSKHLLRPSESALEQ